LESRSERINGYRTNEIVGRDFRFSTRRRILRAASGNAFWRSRREGRYEVSGWQSQGWFAFLASGVIAAVHDDRGSLRGFTIITRDVTKRKLSEEKVRFFADLNQALRPLADPGELMAAAARMLGRNFGRGPLRLRRDRGE